jgi:steroid delta-isomerase
MRRHERIGSDTIQQISLAILYPDDDRIFDWSSISHVGDTRSSIMAERGKVTAAHMRGVFQRYVELVTAGDVDGIVALYAPGATVEDPIGSPIHRGHAAIRAFYTASRGSVLLELDGRVRVAGREGAAAMTARPKGAGAVVIDTLDTMGFDEDGLVTSMRAYWSPETIRKE